MAIEYSLPRIAIISSYINTNKTLILLYLKNRRSGSSHFHAKKWSERLIMRSFLKLASFACNIVITTETFLSTLFKLIKGFYSQS